MASSSNKSLTWIKENYLIILGFIGITYFFIVTFLFIKASPNSLSITSLIDTKAFAEYGSHLAGIGAIFAFFFAFATFWRIESSNRRKDFETTLFNMLTHFDSIIAQIKVNKENRASYTSHKNQLERDYNGRAALNVLLEDFIENVSSGTINMDELMVDDDNEGVDLIPARWKETYELNLESLPHYFRYYYTLVKFIMKSDKRIDKEYYANLLQAKMSSSEMGLIFYNTFYNSRITQQRGAQEFQLWLNDPTVSLLENIDKKSVLSTSDLKAKCPNIKFKFDQTTSKDKIMTTKIKMGNDEFILYIRKTSSTCSLTNDDLGKYIWIWLRERGAEKIKEDVPCRWGKTAQNLDALKLPKTAAQFEFERTLLPELYAYFDELAAK